MDLTGELDSAQGIVVNRETRCSQTENVTTCSKEYSFYQYSIHVYRY